MNVIQMVQIKVIRPVHPFRCYQLNPLRMQKLTENCVDSNAKIKVALGIEQMPVRAKDGLIETIKSFDA